MPLVLSHIPKLLSFSTLPLHNVCDDDVRYEANIGSSMSRNRIFLSLSQQSGFEERYIHILRTHWITTEDLMLMPLELALEIA
jgi:hypothetical protein